jgi:hypothetical protein
LIGIFTLLFHFCSTWSCIIFFCLFTNIFPGKISSKPVYFGSIVSDEED